MSKACSLFSGSSGNSIYMGCGDNQILVDIGVSARRCEQKLRQVGADPAEIKGIFVTHEHGDHAAGVRVFAARYHIPVFAHPAVLEQMARQGNLNEKVDARPFAEVGDFMDLQVSPFALSHDSVACQGYKFTMPDGRRIAVCTDTGYITSAAKAALPGEQSRAVYGARRVVSLSAATAHFVRYRPFVQYGLRRLCRGIAAQRHHPLCAVSPEPGEQYAFFGIPDHRGGSDGIGRPSGGRLSLAGGCSGAGRRVSGAMIRITVLTVGKLKEKYLREGCDEYLKRLSAFSKVQVVELPESRCPADPSPAEIQRVLEQEGDSILAKIPKGARVIPLCIEGRELSSAQLATRVADFSQQSSHLVFVIGGSYGLSPRVKAAGDLQLSFGKMTLPHQLARLVLLEQIYRACAINNHSKYHK
jgi:23S rRNA (pseudouridine1915-N3)-methyltransferase